MADGRSAAAATNGSAVGTATSTRRERPPRPIDRGRAGRLHILEVQRLIRFMPKVVICVVPGWAAGGGHSLHVVADLTLASREHARFKQTDADVASFDGGFGSAYLARQVGQKFAREIFFLGREYSADDAHRMGMVNAVVAARRARADRARMGRLVNAKSPTAQRMLKYSFNLIDDGLVGQQLFAGEATRLALHDGRGRRGSGFVPREALARLDSLPLVLLSLPIGRGSRSGANGGVSPWPGHEEGESDERREDRQPVVLVDAVSAATDRDHRALERVVLQQPDE